MRHQVLGTLPSTLRSMPLLPITSTSAPTEPAISTSTLAASPCRASLDQRKAALLRLLLALAQGRLDVLGRVDHPLQLVGRVAALASGGSRSPGRTPR